MTKLHLWGIRLVALGAIALVSPLVLASDDPPQAADSVSFDKQVRPIFQAHCQGCHQPAKAGGAYVMTNFAKLLAGGESKQAAIVAGKPDESFLLDQITSFEGKAAMPPEKAPLSAADVDALYLESSYFIAPDDGGAKPYALLYSALKASGKVAIAKIVMSHREHIVVIRPGATGLALHTIFYPHEVRSSEEYATNTGLVSDKELALAGSLIDALSGEFDPSQYSDRYRDSILALIEQKKAGKSVTAAPAAAPKKSAVMDISEALMASLSAARGGKKELSAKPDSAKGKKTRVA